MLVSDVASEYRLKFLRSASTDSIRLWNIALRMFDRFLGRPAILDDLNDMTVAEFCVWRRAAGVSGGTVNRDLGSLLALWRWSHKVGYLHRWPDVELERVPARTPVAWTRDEFNRLIAAARDQPGLVGTAPAGLWWSTLLLVLFDTGERVNAVLRLRWNDVDITRRWVIFAAENRKGQASDSVARIASDTAAQLRRLRRCGGPMVFNWPKYPTYLWACYGRLLADAGLPNDRRRKFHCVRKTTASHLAAAGGNATEALRHSSTRITKLYLDPKITKPEQPIDRLWRPE